MTKTYTTDLVKGYILQSPCEPTETLYAVTTDGRVFQTNPLKLPNPDFNRIGRKWTQIDALPEGVTYCGSYERPGAIGAAA